MVCCILSVSFAKPVSGQRIKGAPLKTLILEKLFIPIFFGSFKARLLNHQERKQPALLLGEDLRGRQDQADRSA